MLLRLLSSPPFGDQLHRTILFTFIYKNRVIFFLIKDFYFPFPLRVSFSRDHLLYLTINLKKM
jgi:hypothetical protein